jgi:hypothetical protein
MPITPTTRLLLAMNALAGDRATIVAVEAKKKRRFVWLGMVGTPKKGGVIVIFVYGLSRPKKRGTGFVK